MKPVGSINIGSLLVQAGLIREEDLDAAVDLSKQMKLPVGRVLVSTGFISDEALTAAVDAQSLIREKTVTLEIAVKALKEASEKKAGLADILLEYGLDAKILDYTNKLGQLLVDSEFITEKQRLEALKLALASGLPLGRILVMQKATSNTQALAALSAQILIRTGEISREQAIEALGISLQNKCSLESALKEKGFVKSESFDKFMLGELLMSANQLSEVRFLTSLEQSLIEDSPIEKALLSLGYLTPEQLERAIHAQKQITLGQMSQSAGADYIQQGQNNSPSTTLSEDDSEPKIALSELLVLCKLISHQAILEVDSKSIESGTHLSDILESSKIIEAPVLNAADLFLTFYNADAINAEELILAMNLWLLNRHTHPAEVVRRFAHRA